MYKRLLSVACSVCMLVTMLIPATVFFTKAQAISAGSYPYANEQNTTVNVSNVANGKNQFYSDFVAKSTLDNLTATNFTSTWRLYNRTDAVYKPSSTVLATASLEENNVYGDSGRSYKVSYIKSCNTKISPSKGNADQYFHYVRQNVAFSVSNDFLDTASVAFWVKTAHPVYIVVRLTCNGWDTKDFIVSERITVPAGESIVEIPLGNFMTCNDGYTAINSTGSLKINIADIYFKSTQSFDGTRDIYLDNLGFYYYASCGKNAVHNDGFELKNDIETLTYSSSNGKDKVVDKKNISWTDDDRGTLGVSAPVLPNGSNINAYNSEGFAISYSTDNVYTSTSSNYNYINSNGSIDTKINGETVGKNAAVSLWIKSDRALKVYIRGIDSSWTKNRYRSGEYFVPAGQSILQIPLSDLVTQDNAAVECDFNFVWEKLNSLGIYFKSATPTATTGSKVTVYIDKIGIEKVGNEPITPPTPPPPPTPPVVPEIPDTKHLHQIGFSEVLTSADKWVNKKPENATVVVAQNSEHFHSGNTNVGLNSEALQIDYTNLSATANNVNFYYNDSIRISKADPYIYGETSVLSFWAYSGQSVDVKVSYMDYSVGAGKSVACKPITVTLAAGENIVKIPMRDLAPENENMQYRHCYQLQFAVYENENSYTAASRLWIDAIGFYDSSLVINDKPIDIPEGSYIWWNFDGDNTLEELGDEWTERFAGADRRGIKLSIEKNSENVYSGKGNSLKIVYDRNLGDNGIPCIWHEARMIAYGDGLVFWLKSEEKTNIRIVCTDSESRAVKVDAIPVTIGYNVIKVKWSDFSFMDKNISGSPSMTSISQLQIRPNGCNNGTLWLDQIGFSNLRDDGSNAYYSLYPPVSYKAWYDGVSVIGDDFEGWPGDDDMKFCSEWYFDDTGWISLVEQNGNTVLKMDYDFKNGAKSELVNTTQFDGVDPKGGISFWAKSSEERYYTLKVWLGEQTASVVINGSLEGRYYKIPFSAFWESNRTDKPFKAQSASGVTVQRIAFVTDSSCNPPAVNVSQSCTLWLDDIKFVDSSAYKRAAEVEHYENGVCLKASVDAFLTGVTVKIDKNSDLTDAQKQEYLSKMSGSKIFSGLYKIEAFDTAGISVTPQVAVELIFDVPEGAAAEDIRIYQLFIDGSLSERKVTVVDDKKVKLSVYRLGQYIMGIGIVRR